MIRKLLAALAILIVLAVAGLVLVARGAIGGDAVRRTIEDQLSARVGHPVTIASVGASFFPRVTLDLHGVTIGQPAVATIGEVSIATGLRGLFSRRVEEAEVIVSNGRLPIELAVRVAGAAAAGGSPAGPEGLTIVSVRTLAFRHVELVAEPRSLTVDLESSLTGDRLDVTRLVAQSAGTRLEAHGALTSIARREGTFTASAGRLNLDELVAIVSGLSKGAESAGGSTLNLTLDVTAPGGELGGYTFQKLSSSVHIKPSQIVLQPLRFGMFSGEFDGQLRVTPSGAAPEFALNGDVAGMDMATILSETRGSRSMSGRMGGRLSLTGRGTTSREVLRSARGTGRMAITNGAIPGLEMVRAIVLKFGKPSGAPPAGSGSAFTRLAGTFSLADETLRSGDITFASRDFDMTGGAVVSLETGAVNMQANVALSRELTAQAGTDLRRYAQEGGRVILPAVITGTMAEPAISINLAAALNRALQNELQRQLKGLLDRIIK